MKALILFGSKSDERVYSELSAFLEKDFKVEFEVISAHRNPNRLKEKLDQDDFDMIFAGAGLAAHLPGVCASLTKKPVVGIPVEGNLGGLDALLSILQMPFGVPVLTMDAKNWNSPRELLKLKTDKVAIIASNSDRQTDAYKKEVKRLLEFSKETDFDLTENEIEGQSFKIRFVTEKNQIDSNDKFTIHVPLLNDGQKNDPKMALTIQDWISEGGFWVGINNSRNALKFLTKMEIK